MNLVRWTPRQRRRQNRYRQSRRLGFDGPRAANCSDDHLHPRLRHTADSYSWVGRRRYRRGPHRYPQDPDNQVEVQVVASDNDGTPHTWSGNLYEYRPILVFNKPVLVRMPRVTRIQFDGGNGNDRFTNNTSLPATAIVGGRTDTLYAARVTTAGGGVATTPSRAAAATDTLYGGPGNDQLDGGVISSSVYGPTTTATSALRQAGTTSRTSASTATTT